MANLMFSRFAFIARGLLVASIAGLCAAGLWRGPGWLILMLGVVAMLAVGLWWSARGAATESFIEPIVRATESLEAVADVHPDSLNSDTSPPGMLAESARRLSVAGAKLRASQQRADARHATLVGLLESVNEPVVATDAAGSVVVCNAAAQAMLGVTADRLIGRPVEEAFTQPEVTRLIGEAAEGKVVRNEIRVSTADGPKVWEVSAAPYGPDGSRRAVVLTLSDATERSLALQVRTDFVANASHELRTPISAIRAAVDTLESISPDDAAMHAKLVTMLGNHTHRLEELVRDLLDLSKLESTEGSLESQNVDLAAIGRELTTSFQSACAARRLQIRFEIGQGMSAVQTDRNLLMLILNNLVDNACKFAFEGTEVLISASALPGGKGARFEVTDHGVGIPLGQQQRIFERFFQVDAARSGSSKRGTGLGLSIVKHAVRRLGGSIRVNSVWQQGTTMIVDLPPIAPGAA